MSTCLGYSVIAGKNCEGMTNCQETVGCQLYSKASPPETNFNLGKESKYVDLRGVKRESLATGSWPCRGQQSCNYFDPSNPIISDYVRKMDLMALPPN